MTNRLCFIGDPVLRQKAAEVSLIDDNIKTLVGDMLRIKSDVGGAGLAAPQIGVLLRVLVFMEPVQNQDPIIHKCINPKIISKSEDLLEWEEGCISIQGKKGSVFANVIRPESVVAEWSDINGKIVRRELSGIAARIFQHEIDHLDGILFVDYLSDLKRTMVMEKVRKLTVNN